MQKKERFLQIMKQTSKLFTIYELKKSQVSFPDLLFIGFYKILFFIIIYGLRGKKIFRIKYKILIIFDEIYSGFGKCGYDFYFKKYGITPDIITLSKSLGGGKSSISAYVSNKDVFVKSYGSLSGSLLHSTTYNSLAEECATVIETTNIMNDNNIENEKLLLIIIIWIILIK